MAMHNPPHPGAFIQEVYLAPNEISCRELALKLGVAASTLNRVLNETSGVQEPSGSGLAITHSVFTIRRLVEQLRKQKSARLQGLTLVRPDITLQSANQSTGVELFWGTPLGSGLAFAHPGNHRSLGRLPRMLGNTTAPCCAPRNALSFTHDYIVSPQRSAKIL